MTPEIFPIQVWFVSLSLIYIPRLRASTHPVVYTRFEYLCNLEMYIFICNNNRIFIWWHVQIIFPSPLP